LTNVWSYIQQMFGSTERYEKRIRFAARRGAFIASERFIKDLEETRYKILH
jgi:hypothetical protein